MSARQLRRPLIIARAKPLEAGEKFFPASIKGLRGIEWAFYVDG
ncbi:hypothetical protein [Mechercharimyces sp. CAU 1602]|nr:hypothetical protein [Mechercharimyces sp. CAU 1602]